MRRGNAVRELARSVQMAPAGQPPVPLHYHRNVTQAMMPTPSIVLVIDRRWRSF